MESFFVERERAWKKLVAADHILTQSYPLIKDPKLLLASLKNLFEAVDAGLTAILRIEYARKRIPTVGSDFNARVVTFTHYLAPRYKIPKEFLRFVGEVRETVKEHEQSPIEFVRKEQYVICDESYRIRTLNESQLKKYIERGKGFLGFVDACLEENHK